jgi:hypothetical protein
VCAPALNQNPPAAKLQALHVSGFNVKDSAPVDVKQWVDIKTYSLAKAPTGWSVVEVAGGGSNSVVDWVEKLIWQHIVIMNSKGGDLAAIADTVNSVSHQHSTGTWPPGVAGQGGRDRLRVNPYPDVQRLNKDSWSRCSGYGLQDFEVKKTFSATVVHEGRHSWQQNQPGWANRTENQIERDAYNFERNNWKTVGDLFKK